MAFAIFFELSDATLIAGTMQNTTIPNTLKNRMRTFWNGGIKDWATAPLGHAPGDNSCPACRVIVCTNGTLADFRQVLYDIAAFLGTADGNYVKVLADNMTPEMAGAQEPYP